MSWDGGFGKKKTLINLGTCVLHVNFVEIFMPMLFLFLLLHQQDFEKILIINHDFIIIIMAKHFGQTNKIQMILAGKILTLLNHVTPLSIRHILEFQFFCLQFS